MNEIIEMLRMNAKTSERIDVRDSNYLYHGIYVPYFEDSTSIISIIENGLLTLKEQFEKGIVSLEKLDSTIPEYKGLIKFLKSKFTNPERILRDEKYNIIYFSPNKDLFNRVFDISFMVRKKSKYRLIDNRPTGYNLQGEFDNTEYVTNSSVSPSEFVAIRINLDELLNPKSVEERGVSFEEVAMKIIQMVNDIYDKLEENNLEIPIINSDDGRVLNKELFRQLRDTFGYGGGRKM